MEFQLRRDDVDMCAIPCFPRPSPSPTISALNPSSAYTLSPDVPKFATDRKSSLSPLSRDCDSLHSSSQELDAFYYTWVTYKEKKDQFSDEIEIILPTLLTPSHHFFVTIYTISGSSKRTVFGYVIIPVLVERSALLPNGVSSFPVYSKLPDGYLTAPQESSQFHDNKKVLFTFRSHSISSVYTSDASLGRFFSALESEPEFQTDAEVLSVSGALMDTMDTLPSCDPSALFQFLHIVLDYLIEIVRRGGQDAAEKALSTILSVFEKIRKNYFVGNLNSYLKSYIWIWFLPAPRPIPQFLSSTASAPKPKAPEEADLVKGVDSIDPPARQSADGLRNRSPPSFTVTAEGRGVRRDRSPPMMEVGRSGGVKGPSLISVMSSSTTSSGIASRIVSCQPPFLFLPLITSWLSQLEGSSYSGNETWFILDLLLKNMIIYVISIDKASSTPVLDRSSRFPVEFCDKLEKVMSIILEPSRFTRGHYGIALSARLIQNLLQIYDRGRLFSWLRNYIRQLDHSDRFSSKIKFQILRTLVDDRAFLALNLPIQVPIKSISTLQLTYWKVGMHFNVPFSSLNIFFFFPVSLHLWANTSRGWLPSL